MRCGAVRCGERFVSLSLSLSLRRSLLVGLLPSLSLFSLSLSLYVYDLRSDDRVFWAEQFSELSSRRVSESADTSSRERERDSTL